MLFLLVGIVLLFIFLYDFKIEFYEAALLFSIYIAYVLTVFVGRLIYQKRKKQRTPLPSFFLLPSPHHPSGYRRRLEDERSRLMALGLNLPSSHLLFQLDLSLITAPPGEAEESSDEDWMLLDEENGRGKGEDSEEILWVSEEEALLEAEGGVVERERRRKVLSEENQLRLVATLIDAIEKNDLSQVDATGSLSLLCSLRSLFAILIGIVISESEKRQKERLLHRLLSQLDVSYIAKKGFWHPGIIFFIIFFVIFLVTHQEHELRGWRKRAAPR